MNQTQKMREVDFENYYMALRSMRNSCNSTEQFIQQLAYLFADLGRDIRSLNGRIALFHKGD